MLAAGGVDHMPLCCRLPPKKYPAWPRNQFIEILEPVLLNNCVKWKRNWTTYDNWLCPHCLCLAWGKKRFICLGGFMNV